MGYIPGKENTIADILSRWAYPASQALRDISKHGSQQDKDEMDEIIREEKREEAQCLWLKVKNQPNFRNNFIQGVTTRSGKKVQKEQGRPERGNEGGRVSTGKNTVADTLPEGPRPEKVEEKPSHGGLDAAGNEVGPMGPSPMPTSSAQEQGKSDKGKGPPLS